MVGKYMAQSLHIGLFSNTLLTYRNWYRQAIDLLTWKSRLLSFLGSFLAGAMLVELPKENVVDIKMLAFSCKEIHFILFQRIFALIHLLKSWVGGWFRWLCRFLPWVSFRSPGWIFQWWNPHFFPKPMRKACGMLNGKSHFFLRFAS